MTGSGEKHAQDKNLIWCILVALRPILLLTVYINTLYVQYFVLVLLLLILALTGAIVAMTQVSNGNKENGLQKF